MFNLEELPPESLKSFRYNTVSYSIAIRFATLELTTIKIKDEKQLQSSNAHDSLYLFVNIFGLLLILVSLSPFVLKFR